MGLETSIDRDGRIVVLTASGVLTDDDVFGCLRAIQAAGDAVLEFDLLADLSATEKFEVSTAAIRSLAIESAHRGPRSRRAVIASSDVVYGVGRMYATLRGDGPGQFAVFKTRDDALRWLDRAPDGPSSIV